MDGCHAYEFVSEFINLHYAVEPCLFMTKYSQILLWNYRMLLQSFQQKSAYLKMGCFCTTFLKYSKEQSPCKVVICSILLLEKLLDGF